MRALLAYLETSDDFTFWIAVGAAGVLWVLCAVGIVSFWCALRRRDPADVTPEGRELDLRRLQP